MPKLKVNLWPRYNGEQVGETFIWVNRRPNFSFAILGSIEVQSGLSDLIEYFMYFDCLKKSTFCKTLV